MCRLQRPASLPCSTRLPSARARTPACATAMCRRNARWPHLVFPNGACCAPSIFCICAARSPPPMSWKCSTPLCEHPLLRLASVMDHTPGQRQWHDREQWRRFQERNGKLSDEHVSTALAELTVEQERYADVHRREITARCKALGLPVASHDDTLAEHRNRPPRRALCWQSFRPPASPPKRPASIASPRSWGRTGNNARRFAL